MLGNKKIYFITSSGHKFKEAKFVIPNIKRKKLDLDEIQSFDAKEIVVMKLLSARLLWKNDDIIIVEDTSLYLKCLSGFPGPFVKWMVGKVPLFKIFKICESLKNFKATGVCCIGAYINNKVYTFEGRVEGRIVKPKKTKNSFGWDPIFIPQKSDLRFSEMSLEEKCKFSHRGKAFLNLKNFLYGGRSLIG